MAAFEANMHRLIKEDGYKNPQAFAIAMSTLGRACGVEGKLGSPEEIVKSKSEARLHEYEQYVDDEGYIHDDEGNVEFVGKQYAGKTYGLHGAPSGRAVSMPKPTKKPAPIDQAKRDAENEARYRRHRLEDQLYSLEVSLQVLGPNKRIEAMLDIVKAGKDLSTRDLLFAYDYFKEPHNRWLLNAKLGNHAFADFTPKGYDPGPRSGPSRYRVKPPTAFGFTPKEKFEGRYIPLEALFR